MGKCERCEIEFEDLNCVGEFTFCKECTEKYDELNSLVLILILDKKNEEILKKTVLVLKKYLLVDFEDPDCLDKMISFTLRKYKLNK